MGNPAVDPRVRRTHRDVVAAAAELFLEGGWSAVTHAEVARRSGYAKATIYAHWPTQLDLIQASFEQIVGNHQHHEPAGDLRQDLIDELFRFGQALTEGDLARVIGGLLERAGSDPAVEALLNQMQRNGSATTNAILRAHLRRDDADQLAVLLAGAVYYRATLQGLAPTRAFIAGLVDRLLGTVEPA